MIHEWEIREQLAAYLRQDLPLKNFSDWLGAHSWNMHRDSDSRARRLVGGIELLLAEYLNGDRTEDELRSLFRELLDGISIIRVEVILSGIVPFDVRSARLPTRAIRVASYQELLLTA